MKKFLFSLSMIFAASNFISAQNVGIGTTSPLMKLQVSGTDSAVALLENTQPLSLNTNTGLYFKTGTGILSYTGAIKTIGTGGNTARMGLFTYASVLPGGLKERLSITDDGKVGIGNPTPVDMLDVMGSAAIRGDAYVKNNFNTDGNVYAKYSVETGFDVIAGRDISAQGNITTHGGGVAYNPLSAAPLKIYRLTAAFTTGNLGAHLTTAEGNLGFATSFTTPPTVVVGNITANTGTGPLHLLQLIVYDVTATTCKVRILNMSDATVNQSVTFNVMCVGN